MNHYCFLELKHIYIEIYVMKYVQKIHIMMIEKIYVRVIIIKII